MSDCVFCKIVENQLPAARVYEDERVIAIKDIYPKAQVHILLLPRAHIASLNELGPGDGQLVAHMMSLLPTLAKQLGLTEGFRSIINTGRGGGQEVPHLHIHLLGGGRLPGF